MLVLPIADEVGKTLHNIHVQPIIYKLELSSPVPHTKSILPIGKSITPHTSIVPCLVRESRTVKIASFVVCQLSDNNQETRL